MSLTLGDAKIAMDAVLKKYEAHLDPLVVAGVRNMSVGQIFRILPESQYAPNFNAVFKHFFAAINVVALGGVRKMIDLARKTQDADTNPAIACPAFTAPAVHVTDRVIYVNADAGIAIGTLYHEFVHFLEHGNFYPEYYSLGGNNPKILEGVTEYLTRAVDPKIDAERTNGGKYKAFLDVTLNLKWGTPAETLTKMIKVAFQGDMSSLPA